MRDLIKQKKHIKEWRKRNKEKIRQYQKQYWQQHKIMLINKRREYQKEYAKRNHKRLILYYKQRWLKNKNKLLRQIKKRHLFIKDTYPWRLNWLYAWRRCNQKSNASYKNYGALGIKMLLTVDEVKLLWFQDRAFNMKKPHLHRIDLQKHYSIDNCQFMDSSEHLKFENFRRIKEIKR